MISLAGESREVRNFFRAMCVVFIAILWSCSHRRDSIAFHELGLNGSQSGVWRKLLTKATSNPEYFKKFYLPGPFTVTAHRGLLLTATAGDSLKVDFFKSHHDSPAPLVVIVHGNGYSRLAHASQAERIASWGFHCLTVDVPNRHEWRENGSRIRRLTQLLYSFPQVLATKLDRKKIYLIGHSFGGSAATLAAQNNRKVAGLVLLDPAVVHPVVGKAMKRIKSPVILLGADKKRFRSRKRSLFFKNVSAPMAEISIIGATHEDAQYPSINKVHWGFDFKTDEEKQKVFLANIVTSLFSMARTDDPLKSLGYAWSVFKGQLKSGLIKKARVRSAKN